MKRWRTLRKLMDEYPIGNLEETKNIINAIIGIEVLEFGLASSPKLYIVPREAHFGGVITGNDKSLKKKVKHEV
jgi:hypothetical protein